MSSTEALLPSFRLVGPPVVVIMQREPDALHDFLMRGLPFLPPFFLESSVTESLECPGTDLGAEGTVCVLSPPPPSLFTEKEPGCPPYPATFSGMER